MKLKPTANSFRNLAAVFIPMVFVGLPSLEAAPILASTGTNIVQSVFVLPDAPKEGRDPFFPNSIRPYKDRVPLGQTPVSSLKLEGITRSHGKVFVIINSVTFGIGDEVPVKTSGGKVDVHCVQINADSVVVEVGGQLLTLTLTNP